MNALTLRCPAKINLTLAVTGKRGDGYHLLSSVMQTVSLSDTVTLEPTSSGEIQLFLRNTKMPALSTNTAVRSAAAFFEHLGKPVPGLRITLTKRIPMQAGMGGGSADAAGVLRGLNRLYGSPLSPDELLAIGAGIGADVPFCLQQGCALCEGIGEMLTPLPAMPMCELVVIKPHRGISTVEAYRRIDTADSLDMPDSKRMIDALKRQDLTAVTAGLGNVFEQVAKLPEVDEARQALTDSGALGSMMTGSGSAVFGIFAEAAPANRAAAVLRKQGKIVYRCHPLGSQPPHRA